MKSLEVAGLNLATEIELAQGIGLVIHSRIEDEVPSTYTSPLTDEFVGILAHALDRNPRLIVALMQSLGLIKEMGVNADLITFNDLPGRSLH